MPDLRKTRRERIRYQPIKEKLPMPDDKEYAKCVKRFELLHHDSKSTAKKARIEHKRKLFMIIMRVIFAIRRLKLEYRTEMKIERSKIYHQELHHHKKDDNPRLKSYYRPKGDLNDSFEEVATSVIIG